MVLPYGFTVIHIRDRSCDFEQAVVCPCTERHMFKSHLQKIFPLFIQLAEFFYLASGYGERPSFGYNIKVNDLYSKGDVLYLDTTLTGPEEGAVVKKAPSYPFIVIKLKASGTDKKVEFIM